MADEIAELVVKITGDASDLESTINGVASELSKLEKAQGGGFTGDWMGLLPFTDAPDWVYESIAWCYQEGITTGTSADSFSPDDDCTRAQIVTFLYRSSMV